MRGGERRDRASWRDGARDEIDHLREVAHAEWPAVADAPEVRLVGFAGMKAVDGVATVHDARTDEEHVVRSGGIGGEAPEERGDHRRRLRAEGASRRQVAGVAGVPRRAIRGIVEPVVVVLDRHDRACALDHDAGAPRRRECGDGGVEDLLDCVRTLRRIGEIAHGERAPEGVLRQWDDSRIRRHGSDPWRAVARVFRARETTAWARRSPPPRSERCRDDWQAYAAIVRGPTRRPVRDGGPINRRALAITYSTSSA
jgi:hypothetical protein